MDWWHDHNELARLASWMIAEGHAAEQIIEMLEKPWNWTAEHDQALTAA